MIEYIVFGSSEFIVMGNMEAGVDVGWLYMKDVMESIPVQVEEYLLISLGLI